MKRTITFIILSTLFSFALSCFGQDTDSKPAGNKKLSHIKENKKEPVKTRKRFSPVPLPVVGFDADMGFQYGLMLDIYDYGKSWVYYPRYKHNLKFEVSRFTRGSGLNQVFYDSKYLIPGNIRITADMSYFTEKKLDFSGFNGYETIYDRAFITEDNPAYISRVFYSLDRKLFRFTADLQGPLHGDRLRWLAGIGIMNFKIKPVDINALNKGKDEAELLSDTATLFEKYISWGIIPENEKKGGNINFIKFGLVYDTRDNEANPMKGMWTEALLVYSPGFLSNRDKSFVKLVLVQRNYFTLLPKKLSLAFRLAYQGTIGGHTPFYFQPYMLSSFSAATYTDGLGGAKNLRGIVRDRVVGDGVAYGNLELRWIAWRFALARQNFYLGMVFFGDAGMVVQKIKYDTDMIEPAELPIFFRENETSDHLHSSAGAGLRVSMNENFILSVDYGFALNPADGLSGLYVGFKHLF